MVVQDHQTSAGSDIAVLLCAHIVLQTFERMMLIIASVTSAVYHCLALERLQQSKSALGARRPRACSEPVHTVVTPFATEVPERLRKLFGIPEQQTNHRENNSFMNIANFYKCPTVSVCFSTLQTMSWRHIAKGKHGSPFPTIPIAIFIISGVLENYLKCSRPNSDPRDSQFRPRSPQIRFTIFCRPLPHSFCCFFDNQHIDIIIRHPDTGKTRAGK